MHTHQTPNYRREFEQAQQRLLAAFGPHHLNAMTERMCQLATATGMTTDQATQHVLDVAQAQEGRP